MKKPHTRRFPADKTQKKHTKSNQGAQSIDKLCHKCGYSSAHEPTMLQLSQITCTIWLKVEETEIQTSDDDSASDNDYAHLISAIGNQTADEWYENVKV